MRSTPWQASLPASNVLNRIRELMLEMQAIQHELCSELALPDGTPKSNSIAASLRSADDLGILRTAVDQFRRVLWFYVDQNSQKSSPDGAKLPLLEPLQPVTAPPPVSKLQETPRREAGPQPPVSFFDRLELVVEGYMKPSGPLAAFRKTPES
jgi:hypothetical protein